MMIMGPSTTIYEDVIQSGVTELIAFSIVAFFRNPPFYFFIMSGAFSLLSGLMLIEWIR